MDLMDNIPDIMDKSIEKALIKKTVLLTLFQHLYPQCQNGMLSTSSTASIATVSAINNKK